MGESFEGVGVLSAPLTPKVHPPPDLQAARCAEGQHGIITTRQLAARGLGSQAITVRVRAGRLEARLARVSPSYWTRWRAKWVARRARAVPGQVGGSFGRGRQLAYRYRQGALARVRR